MSEPELKSVTCYSTFVEDCGVRITFVPSGYKNVWIKVVETFDYLLSVEYIKGSPEEEIKTIVKKIEKKEEKIEKYFSNITDDQLASDAKKADYSFYKHVDPKNDGLSLATPRKEIYMEENEYYKFFHSTILDGITCGLDHPVEWIINAHRTPGGTLTPAYYWKVEKFVPRFLVEIFESLYLRRPDNATEVLEMCDTHYPEGHLCRGYFNFLKADIEKYLKEVE